VKNLIVSNRIREYSFVFVSRCPFFRTTTNRFPLGENFATRPLEEAPSVYCGSPRRVIWIESATVTGRLVNFAAVAFCVVAVPVGLRLSDCDTTRCQSTALDMHCR